MAIKKIVAKKMPTVTVETKKIVAEDSSCCPTQTKCCGIKPRKIINTILLLLNTILLVVLLVNQSKIETLKVGGAENYKMLRELFMTEGFKTEQKLGLEKALNIYKNPQAAQQAAQQQAAQPAQDQAQPAIQQ